MPWKKKPDGSNDYSQPVEGRFADPLTERLVVRWTSFEAIIEFLNSIREAWKME